MHERLRVLAGGCVIILALSGCAIRNIGETSTLIPDGSSQPVVVTTPTPDVISCDDTVALDNYIQAIGSAVIIARPIVESLEGATPLDAREQIARVRTERERVASIQQVPECALSIHRQALDVLNNTVDQMTAFTNGDIDRIDFDGLLGAFDAVETQIEGLESRRSTQMFADTPEN